MNVYVVKVTGHWPVGACGVVVAKDDFEAQGLLNIELEKQGLKPSVCDEWQEIEIDKPQAVIVLNGDY